jgi:hypothetical protein
VIDELHRRIGHVAHAAARNLVKKGLVHRIELDESSELTVCESCEFAKVTQKPIQKFREANTPKIRETSFIRTSGDPHPFALSTTSTLSVSQMKKAGCDGYSVPIESSRTRKYSE